MGLNTYPANPFPPSTDQMDADTLEAEVSKLKSGLTNVQDDVKLNTQDLTTPSRTANLYNKNDDYLLAYIDTNDGVLYESTGATIVWIKCKPNTIYTVSKQAGTRFMVATTRVKPALGVQTYGYIEDFTASSITITTDSNAIYLVAYVYANGDQPTTREEMLATVQIEEGSTATAYTPYIPSVDARLDAVNTVTSSTSGGFGVFTVGKLVMLNKKDGGTDTDASGNVLYNGEALVLPSDIRPVELVTVLDAYSKKRIQIKTNGNVVLPDDASATNLTLRFTATYLTS